MKKILAELNNQRLSLLFTIILTYWAMTSFFGMPIIDILLMIVVVNTVLYICYIFLKKQGLAGGVLFVLGSVVYFIGIQVIILFSGKSNLYYLIWMVMAKPESIEVVTAFWYATILIASYGFSSTVFYFTNISFRIPILLLIGAIPFMLQSAKADSDVTIPFLLFGVVFFWLYIERTAKKTSDLQRGFHINNRWYILSASIFVGLILTLGLIIPKPETIPKIAYINQAITETVQNLAQTNGQNIDVANITNIFNTMGIKNQSVLDSSTPPLGDRVLFEVEAIEPLYFRVQSWDKYAENRWLKANKMLDEKRDINHIKDSYYRLSVLVDLMQRMEKNGLLSTEYSKLTNNLDGTLGERKARQAFVSTKGVPMQSLLSPPGVFGFGLSGNPIIYINDRSECYMANGKMPSRNEYFSIDYYSQNFSHSSMEYSIMRHLNKEIVSGIFDMSNFKLREDGKEVTDGLLVIEPETKAIVEEVVEDMNSAYDNYLGLPDNTSERIYDLADSITEGFSSDFDKANAIVNFFYRAGFKYDLTPPSLPRGRDYNDFFIFESKKGFCMHYASAMVILARASGLPARYVEGFVADEWDPETGNYLIREKDAHAFPEVYISGYGWMVFEPTVEFGGSQDKFSIFFSSIFNKIKNIVSAIWRFILDMPFWFKLLFIPYIVFSLLFVIWLYFWIRRSIWKNKVLSEEKSQAISMVFAKISNLLKKIGLEIDKHETPSCYAIRIFEASGIDLLGFVESFSKCKYGGIEPDEKTILYSIEIYNEVRQVVKKRVGRLKSWVL